MNELLGSNKNIQYKTTNLNPFLLPLSFNVLCLSIWVLQYQRYDVLFSSQFYKRNFVLKSYIM